MRDREWLDIDIKLKTSVVPAITNAREAFSNTIKRVTRHDHSIRQADNGIPVPIFMQALQAQLRKDKTPRPTGIPTGMNWDMITVIH